MDFLGAFFSVAAPLMGRDLRNNLDNLKSFVVSVEVAAEIHNCASCGYFH